MKQRKQIWAWLLCLVLIFGMITPLHVAAEEDSEDEEPMTITAFYLTGEVPTEDNLLAELMKDELGGSRCMIESRWAWAHDFMSNIQISCHLISKLLWRRAILDDLLGSS